MYVQRNFKAR